MNEYGEMVGKRVSPEDSIETCLNATVFSSESGEYTGDVVVRIGGIDWTVNLMLIAFEAVS